MRASAERRYTHTREHKCIAVHTHTHTQMSRSHVQAQAAVTLPLQPVWPGIARRLHSSALPPLSHLGQHTADWWVTWATSDLGDKVYIHIPGLTLLLHTHIHTNKCTRPIGFSTEMSCSSTSSRHAPARGWPIKIVQTSYLSHVSFYFWIIMLWMVLSVLEIKYSLCIMAENAHTEKDFS